MNSDGFISYLEAYIQIEQEKGRLCEDIPSIKHTSGEIVQALQEVLNTYKDSKGVPVYFG